MKKLSLLLVLFISLAPIMASGTTFREAMRYYNHKDYSTAFSSFYDLSLDHNPQAYFMIGKMFAYGQGVEKKFVQAYCWLHYASLSHVKDSKKLLKNVKNRMTRLELKKGKKLVSQNSFLFNPDNHYPEINDRMIVARVQTNLKRLGYFRGNTNGYINSRTRSAIKRYQEDHNLRPDGLITSLLLDSLFHLNRTEKPRHERISPWTNHHPGSDSQKLNEFKQRLEEILISATRKKSAEPWVLRQLHDLSRAKNNSNVPEPGYYFR